MLKSKIFLKDFIVEINSFNEISLPLIRDNSYDIKELHLELLNNIHCGWYAIATEIKSNSRYLLNDHISSYRTYINTSSLEYSNKFWDLVSSNSVIDKGNQKMLLNRGYFTGEKTIIKEIVKLLPAHIFDFQTKHQYYTPIINEDDSTTSLGQYLSLTKDLEESKSKFENIVIAFSGGLDSTFIANILSNKTKENITLCYMFCPAIDQEAEVNLNQSKLIASLLGLPLKVIDISVEDLEKNISKLIYKYPNDCSLGFVAITIFLSKIREEINPDVIFTGQNSDSFISFGLTRKNHPLETLSRILYYNSFKKLYYEKPLNLIDKVLLFITYKTRGIPCKQIPRNKKDLIDGLSNERFYLPIAGLKNSNQGKYKFESLNYEHFLIYNKLINHIAGNHSLVWSINEKVIMPFSRLSFIRESYLILTNPTIRSITNPKFILEKFLSINFKRKKISIFSKFSGSYKSSLSPSLITTFNEQFKKILEEASAER